MLYRMVAFYNRFRKGNKKGKKQVKVRPPPKKGGMTFAKKVNQIIARNVENKITTSYNDQSSVVSTSATGTFQWYLLNNWNVKLFTISQGTTVQSRIGNQIKLKRWVIQGQIAPYQASLEVAPTTLLPSSMTGTIDIYFGRLLNNNEISNSLTALFENGNSSADPAGSQAQIFRKVNKDEYKIYYHKRFKMSPANTAILPLNTAISMANNDYSLTRTFGFDVCKYICKNSVIKYNDTDNDPNHDMIRRLALFATYTPAVGDLEKGASYANKVSFYKINLQAYAEYEDA